MNRTLLNTCCLLAFCFLLGCSGSSNSNKLTGKITMDGSPLANATIELIPLGTTEGVGAFGNSDENGVFYLTTKQGKDDIPPGEYKVTVSRLLNPDGSLPDPNVPPIESQAKETMPAHYLDPEKTRLRLTITPEKKQYEIVLEKVKK